MFAWQKKVPIKAYKPGTPPQRVGQLFGNIPPVTVWLNCVVLVDLRPYYYCKGSHAFPLLQIISLGIPLQSVQCHIQSSRQMEGGKWGRHSFAALRLAYATGETSPWETQDTLLFSSNLKNSHENLTKCNSGSKTTVQVHKKGLWNNLNSVPYISSDLLCKASLSWPHTSAKNFQKLLQLLQTWMWSVMATGLLL